MTRAFLNPVTIPIGLNRRRAVAAIGLLTLALVVGMALWWRHGRPERYLAEAERQFKAGRYLEAGRRLDVAGANPRTADRARLLRARIALERGRPADAVQPLEAVDRRGPWASDAAFWKGRTLQAIGNYPLALAWYRTALEGRPNDPETLRWLASAAYDLGDLGAAVSTLRRLTELRPDDAPAWRTLGLVTLELPEAGELEMTEATRFYQKSLALDPDQPRARLELADVLVRRGDHDEAGRQLERCRGYVPEPGRLHLLARIAWAQGDRDGCLVLLEAGLARDPNHAGLLTVRARIAQADGRMEEAVDWCSRAIAAQPFDPQSYYLRALPLRVLGRSDEAEADFRRAEELKNATQRMSELNAQAADQPTDPEVRCELGRLCERLGRRELAASWYRAALACDPRHEAARAGLAATAIR